MADKPDILLEDDQITAVGSIGVHWREDDPETIFLNSQYGNVRLGSDGTDGDLFLEDQGGDTRIHLDAGHGPVNRDEVRVYLDGDGAEAVLGDAGARGALRVKDDDGTETGTLAEGRLALGGDGRAGRHVVETTAGTPSIRLDGEDGTATLGGIGGSGDVVVRETVQSRLEVPSGDDETVAQFRVLVTDAGTVEPQSTRLPVDDDFELVLVSPHAATDLQLAVRGMASQVVTLPRSQVTVDGTETVTVGVTDVALATTGTLEVATAGGARASVELRVQPDAPPGNRVGPRTPVPVPRVHLDGDASGPLASGVRSHLAGDGTVTLGGDGEAGTVRLRDTDGTDVGEVDVEDGRMRLSDGSGGPELVWDPSSGDLTVRDAAGNDALSFDAASGDLDIAGSLNENV